MSWTRLVLKQFILSTHQQQQQRPRKRVRPRGTDWMKFIRGAILELISRLCLVVLRWKRLSDLLFFFLISLSLMWVECHSEFNYFYLPGGTIWIAHIGCVFVKWIFPYNVICVKLVDILRQNMQIKNTQSQASGNLWLPLSFVVVVNFVSSVSIYVC